jgi:hypothetical protein
MSSRGDDLSPLTPELTAYILRAMQVEIFDLRKELHGDYLNEAQMKNVFFTREERDREAAIRRDWPTRVFAGAAAIAAIVDAILRAGGH